MFELVVGFLNNLLVRIGQKTDAASNTGSLHAKVTDNRNQIGASGDAANSAGSAHAKVADVRNAVGAVPTNPMKARTTRYVGNVNIPANTTSNMTVLSVSGKGKLHFAFMTSTSPTYTNMIITIDGVQISSGAGTFGESGGSASSGAGTASLGWEFNSSLLIQATNTNTSTNYTASATYSYE